MARHAERIHPMAQFEMSPNPFSMKGRMWPSIVKRLSSISLPHIGIMVLFFTLLLTIIYYILQTQLNYPALFLYKQASTNGPVVQGSIAPLFCFGGLLLCGILLFIISLCLAPSPTKQKRGSVVTTGSIAALCWIISALLSLVLMAFWNNAAFAIEHVLAMIIFVLAEIATPLLLLFWTSMLSRQFHRHMLVGVLGLALVLLRSLVWELNALLPIEAGFYATAGLLNLFALLGESLWLVWLALFGFRLLSKREERTEVVQAQDMTAKEQAKGRVKRRTMLKLAIGLGIGVASGAFVLARTSATIVAASALDSSDVPAEPSFIGTLYYLLLLVYLKLNPTTTVAQQLALAQNATPQPLPPDISLEHVDASGVPAQIIRAPGATRNRVIFYVHGGGWAVPLADQDRISAASLSQATGAAVFLPVYRLMPKHPFPAGINDCVTAYRWLLNQGVAASQVVFIGGSAGGNLVLAMAVALLKSGDALPAAVIASSPPTDLSMTGGTHISKASVDPVLGWGLAKNSYAAYVNNNPAELRNPLVSPLYADLHGFPPTFLLVGTQEILLSDSILMAERLKAASVSVKLEIWPGMFHGWEGQSALPEARIANQHKIQFIRRHLGI